MSRLLNAAEMRTLFGDDWRKEGEVMQALYDMDLPGIGVVDNNSGLLLVAEEGLPEEMYNLLQDTMFLNERYFKKRKSDNVVAFPKSA